MWIRTPLHRAASVAFACTAFASFVCGAGGCKDSTFAFCARTQDFAAHCADPCLQAEGQQCSTLASHFSEAFMAAVVSCVNPPYSCPPAGASPTAAYNDCISASLNAATPTAVQEKVKTDFCGVCPDGKALIPKACTNFFSPGGVGNSVLMLSDVWANQVDAQCVPAAQNSVGCAATFAICASVIAAATAPQQCANQTGPDGGALDSSTTDG